MRFVLAPPLFAFAALATLAACQPIHVVPLNPAPHPMPARPAAEVEMYTSRRPSRPYVEVASLGTWSDLGAVRARAGQLGCDALIVVTSPTATGTTGTTGTAICVAWVEAPPPGGPALAATPSAP